MSSIAGISWGIHSMQSPNKAKNPASNQADDVKTASIYARDVEHKIVNRTINTVSSHLSSYSLFVLVKKMPWLDLDVDFKDLFKSENGSENFIVNLRKKALEEISEKPLAKRFLLTIAMWTIFSPIVLRLASHVVTGLIEMTIKVVAGKARDKLASLSKEDCINIVMQCFDHVEEILKDLQNVPKDKQSVNKLVEIIAAHFKKATGKELKQEPQQELSIEEIKRELFNSLFDNLLSYLKTGSEDDWGTCCGLWLVRQFANYNRGYAKQLLADQFNKQVIEIHNNGEKRIITYLKGLIKSVNFSGSEEVESSQSEQSSELYEPVVKKVNAIFSTLIKDVERVPNLIGKAIDRVSQGLEIPEDVKEEESKFNWVVKAFEAQSLVDNIIGKAEEVSDATYGFFVKQIENKIAQMVQGEMTPEIVNKIDAKIDEMREKKTIENFLDYVISKGLISQGKMVPDVEEVGQQLEEVGQQLEEVGQQLEEVGQQLEEVGQQLLEEVPSSSSASSEINSDDQAPLENVLQDRLEILSNEYVEAKISTVYETTGAKTLVENLWNWGGMAYQCAGDWGSSAYKYAEETANDYGTRFGKTRAYQYGASVAGAAYKYTEETANKYGKKFGETRVYKYGADVADAAYQYGASAANSALDAASAAKTSALNFTASVYSSAGNKIASFFDKKITFAASAVTDKKAVDHTLTFLFAKFIGSM